MMMRCGAVTFDVTNTILRVRGSPAYQYAEAAKSLSYPVSVSKLSQVYRPTWQTMKDKFPNYGIQQGLSTKQFWSIFVHKVFWNAGYRSDSQLLEKVSDKLWSSFESGDNWEPLPHSQQVLQTLRSRNFKVGIISNFDNRLPATLSRHNLEQYFDFVLTSGNTGLEKPGLGMFQVAVEQSGFGAADMVHVGDDLEDDYRAARMAGYGALLLDVGGQYKDRCGEVGVDPDHVVSDLAQLLSKVQSLN